MSRIAFLHSPDLWHFLPGVEAVFAKAGHEVRRVEVTRAEHLSEACEWADVVWVEFANELAAAAAQAHPRKLIVRCHSYEAYGVVKRVNWNWVQRLVVTSQHVLDIAKENCPLIATVPTTLIPSGVDAETFPLQPHKHGTRIGVVAYIGGGKQPGLWLQALVALRQYEPFTLHVAGREQGSDEWMRYLRGMGKVLGLTGAVEFCGHVDDIAEWWRDKDYCLSASMREGCPYNVLEAMACGVRPLIHAYPGAVFQFCLPLLWYGTEGLARQVAKMKYMGYADDWRDGFEETYTLQGQTAALLGLVEDVGGKLSASAAGIPSSQTNPAEARSDSAPSTKLLCTLGMIALVQEPPVLAGAVTLDQWQTAIRSVEAACDEAVIVLDDRSEPLLVVDGKPGIRHIRRRWTDSFCEARNAVHDHARGEWILVLDADDHFETLGNLRESMKVAPPECHVLLADVRNVDENGELLEAEKQIVAYRNDSRIRWEKHGHNQLMGWEKWAATTAVLVSVYPKAAARARCERTLPLLLRDLAENPMDAHAPYHLAKTYAVLGDLANCIKYAQIAVDMSPDSVAYVGAWRYLVWATLDTKGLDGAEALIARMPKKILRCGDIRHVRAFIEAARMVECVQDPDNEFNSTNQVSPRYIVPLARAAKSFGWPMEEVPPTP